MHLISAKEILFYEKKNRYQEIKITESPNLLS